MPPQMPKVPSSANSYARISSITFMPISVGASIRCVSPFRSIIVTLISLIVRFLNNFRNKSKFHRGVLALCHLDRKLRICQKHQLSSFISCQIFLLYSLKLSKFFVFWIFCSHPTSFKYWKVFIGTLCTIFVFQSILNYFVLQGANRSDYFSSIHFQRKQLRYTFVHQLVNPFFQLFRLHRIRIVNVSEMLRRETWYSSEIHYFSLCKCIANLEVSSVGQAHNITSIRRINNLFLFGKKGTRTREFKVFP